jgi:hypothetical protein
MSIAELKLQLISKIMQSDDIDFANRIEQVLKDDYNEKGNIMVSQIQLDRNTVIAYRADGSPLTIYDLKAEIMDITDDGSRGSKPAANCSMKTRLKGILWL